MDNSTKKKGFESLFENNNPTQTKSEQKLKTISLYLRDDYAEKLKEVAYYKRKGGSSKYLQQLIKKELEKNKEIFNEALSIYIQENKKEKDLLRELGIL